MALTLSGTKYTGNVTSYVNRQLVTNANFLSGDFTTPRIVAIFTSSNVFKGFAPIRRRVSATTLELDFNPIDPADNTEISITGSDKFDVSKNLAECAGGGMSVSGTEVIVSTDLIFGASGNTRSLCLFDEEKDLRQTAGGVWQGRGGVVVFGHLLNRISLASYAPVNMVFNLSSTRFRTASTAFHFAMYGGSIFAQATPAYFGGYQGSAGGTLVLSKTKVSQMDLISVGAGAAWGANADRHVLRNITHFINKNNAIAMRWGDGIIEGGDFRLSESIALSLFGTDVAGTYTISAPAGERVVAQEIGNGTSNKPALIRSSSPLAILYDLINVVSANRRFTSGVVGSSNSNGSMAFYFTDAYKNGVDGTKIFILKDSDGSVADNGIVSGSSPLELTVLEAQVTGGSNEAVVENAWKWGACRYGKNLIIGVFTTTLEPTIAGDAKNVAHGATLIQSDDLNVTEANYATALSYTTHDTPEKTYDQLDAIFERDYVGEQEKTVAKSGNNLIFSRDVTLDVGAGQAIVTTNNVTLFGDYTGALTANTVTQKGAPKTLNYSVDGTFVLEEAGTWTADGGTFTEILNTSAGSVVVNLTNGATASTTTPGTGAGQVDIIIPPITLTITSNISLIGAEIRLYDADSAGVDKGTDIDGVESNASASFSTALITPGNEIFIQIIQIGVEEEETIFTMGSASQSINILRKPEAND